MTQPSNSNSAKIADLAEVGASVAADDDAGAAVVAHRRIGAAADRVAGDHDAAGAKDGNRRCRIARCLRSIADIADAVPRDARGVVAAGRAPNLNAVVAAALDAVVGDDEAGRIGGKDAAGGDVANAVALDPAAAAAQAQADAGGAFDDAVGDRELADMGKVDEALVAVERPVGAVEGQPRERDARAAVGRDERSAALEHEPRRAGNADEPGAVGQAQGRGAQRSFRQDDGTAGAGRRIDARRSAAVASPPAPSSSPRPLEIGQGRRPPSRSRRPSSGVD